MESIKLSVDFDDEARSLHDRAADIRRQQCTEHCDSNRDTHPLKIAHGV